MIHPELLRRLCRARDALREWDDARVPIAKIARESGLSLFHFIRLFKAVFGVTPHRFRSAAQIEKAKHLLILSDASVTDVCMAVGFSSLGSFSALFRRRVGISPSAFQNRYRVAAGQPRVLPSELIPGCLTLMGRAAVREGNFEEARKRPDW